MVARDKQGSVSVDFGWASDEWLIVLSGLSVLAILLLVLLAFAMRRKSEELGPNFYASCFALIVTVIISIVGFRFTLYGSFNPKPPGEPTATVVLGPVGTLPGTSDPTDTPSPTNTPEPTSTPEPTPTPEPTATPAPTAVPVEGEVAYRDDFADPGASQLGTGSSNPSLYRLDIVDGQYRMETLDPNAASSLATLLPGTYGDVVVAVDARLVGETEDRLVSVTCRDDPGTTGDTRYRLSVDPTGASFRLELWQGGEAMTLAHGERRDVIKPDNLINRVELRCIGTEITAVINGFEVARVEDGALTEGQVLIGTGLAAGRSGTVAARFDNLVVTSVSDAP
jgi:hypothetical protein